MIFEAALAKGPYVDLLQGCQMKGIGIAEKEEPVAFSAAVSEVGSVRAESRAAGRSSYRRWPRRVRTVLSAV